MGTINSEVKVDDVCVFCRETEASHQVVEDGYRVFAPCLESIGATIGTAPFVYPDDDDWPASAKRWLGE